MFWIFLACLSALFAGLSSILAKCGIKKTDSDIATAFRTVVVILFSFLMTEIVGSLDTLATITPKSLLFLILSGLATGASWLCYYKALSQGNINCVVPVDKSSSVISVLLAIIIFGETNSLAVKLIGITSITVGTLMMIERRPEEPKQIRRTWLIWAILSAVFASLTSVLAKVGIEGVESNLGTFIRTCVVLLMSFLIIAIKGKIPQIRKTPCKELIFIILSGIATGASWLCYYRAIQLGQLSVVVPIDKLSILVTITFSTIVFHEKLTRKSFVGLILITVGTLAMAIFA